MSTKKKSHKVVIFKATESELDAILELNKYLIQVEGEVTAMSTSMKPWAFAILAGIFGNHPD